MIGFTSQLTHAIAVSLVNSDTEDDTKILLAIHTEILQG